MVLAVSSTASSASSGRLACSTSCTTVSSVASVPSDRLTRMVGCLPGGWSQSPMRSRISRAVALRIVHDRLLILTRISLVELAS